MDPGRVRMLIEGAAEREHAEWRRTAWHVAYMLNVHRDPKKHPKPIQPDDLLKPKQTRTPREEAEARRRLTERFQLKERFGLTSN